ncbi:PAN2-PAN3 deadenylation complex catalytic subunit PAN2-like isoform X2 [Gordionus sp. m RMFG-2023]|uniref:PAN2-PAN3 deadenylation complex catalytic subunit PAN2-like isoform X2 n=1 Tax=Gordionus sp. m RMFG-2023 TaxID=3053472 RepID=UPI0031FD182B
MSALYSMYIENKFPEYQYLYTVQNDEGSGYGISALHFDLYEELLWVGNQEGHVTSYFSDHLLKYTSFQVYHSEDIKVLLTNDFGLFALTSNNLKLITRQGIPQMTLKLSNDTIFDAKCMVDIAQLNYPYILIGGHNNKILVIDIINLNLKSEYELEESYNSCDLMKMNDKSIFTSHPNGKICVRDASDFKVQHEFSTHQSAILDFDVSGNTIVACGFYERNGMINYERFIKVFDIRTYKTLPPIQINIDPFTLKFLHTYTERLLVLAQNGNYQLIDPKAGSNAPSIIYNFDTRGSLLTSIALSSNNRVLALGDINGTVRTHDTDHNKTISTPLTFNSFSRPALFPDPQPRQSHSGLVPQDYLLPPEFILSGAPLASDWPARFVRKYDRKSLSIDEELLKNMKVSQFVGYVPNPPGRITNLVPYDKAILSLQEKEAENYAYYDPLYQKIFPSAPIYYDEFVGVNRLKETSKPEVTSRLGNKDSNSLDSKNLHSLAQDSKSLILVPQIYGKQKIRTAWKPPHSEKINFRNYNPTPFPTLQFSSHNTYINALIQILYFIVPFRSHILNHLCTKEYCMSCELAFLFHMMNMASNNEPSQPLNLVRAFKNLPETSALGLILEEKEQHRVGKLMKTDHVSTLIQNFNRFILPQMHSETVAITQNEKSPDFRDSPKNKPDHSSIQSKSPIQQLFMSEMENVLTCCECNVSFTITSRPYCFTFKYPPYRNSSIDETNDRTFEDFVEKAILYEQNVRCYCESCKKFQPVTQVKKIDRLANVLILNCQANTPEKLGFWASKSEQICNSHDSNCNSWILPKLELKSNEFNEPYMYELLAIIADVSEPEKGSHLVDLICLEEPEVYPVSKAWYLFNDFCVFKVSQENALDFSPCWKHPCALYYIKSQLNENVSVSVKNPIDFSTVSRLLSGPNLLESTNNADTNNANFNKNKETCPTIAKGILNPGVVPLDFKVETNLDPAHFFISLDAEFVVLNQQEAHLHSDGSHTTIKPGRLALARITCVRGFFNSSSRNSQEELTNITPQQHNESAVKNEENKLEGVPFLDEYICVPGNQVADYVTKYSGIRHGDLEVHTSSKNPIGLKSVYIQLRYLVDCGYTFLGHNVTKDFQIINITVPQTQIIDTAILFSLPKKRSISLKFLVWYYFGKIIQQETHDSVEDAVCTLKLYKLYLELTEKLSAEKFAQNLKDLYQKGHSCNWEIPSS